ncbi:diguanylate cyclase [Ectopseudomonas mendocina]|uniref:Diguanylate cyclase n=1 Tax=Ectopseudomonas mendocina TaxID=300 RepID=A0ABZ2RHD7_ECTME
MNRRKPIPTQPSPSLRRLMDRAHLRLTLLAISLTCLPLVLISLITLSSYATQNLQLIARSMAYSLGPAVIFKDREAVQEALNQVLETEDVAQVSVYDEHGHLLASREANRRRVLSALEDLTADLLLSGELTHTITDHDAVIGKLHIRGQGSSMLQYLFYGLIGLLASLALSTVGAVYASKRMQRVITRPLRHLSLLAHSISMDRKFNQRVPATQIEEFNDLADDFNSLLDQLEAWQHQLESEKATLAHKASHDALTGLPNRAFFNTRLLEAIRESRSAKSSIAVMFLDSNRFKEINDQLGHAAGDTVLTAIARRLQAQLREDDVVARLGGDEFAVLLKPIFSEDDAGLIADKINASMLEPIQLDDGRTICTSLSIGIAMYPQHADTPEGLLHRADAAMYKAKRNQHGHNLA